MYWFLSKCHRHLSSLFPCWFQCSQLISLCLGYRWSPCLTGFALFHWSKLHLKLPLKLAGCHNSERFMLPSTPLKLIWLFSKIVKKIVSSLKGGTAPGAFCTILIPSAVTTVLSKIRNKHMFRPLVELHYIQLFLHLYLRTPSTIITVFPSDLCPLYFLLLWISLPST